MRTITRKEFQELEEMTDDDGRSWPYIEYIEEDGEMILDGAFKLDQIEKASLYFKVKLGLVRVVDEQKETEVVLFERDLPRGCRDKLIAALKTDTEIGNWIADHGPDHFEFNIPRHHPHFVKSVKDLNEKYPELYFGSICKVEENEYAINRSDDFTHESVSEKSGIGLIDVNDISIFNSYRNPDGTRK